MTDVKEEEISLRKENGLYVAEDDFDRIRQHISRPQVKKEFPIALQLWKVISVFLLILPSFPVFSTLSDMSPINGFLTLLFIWPVLISGFIFQLAIFFLGFILVLYYCISGRKYYSALDFVSLFILIVKIVQFPEAVQAEHFPFLALISIISGIALTVYLIVIQENYAGHKQLKNRIEEIYGEE